MSAAKDLALLVLINRNPSAAALDYALDFALVAAIFGKSVGVFIQSEINTLDISKVSELELKLDQLREANCPVYVGSDSSSLSALLSEARQVLTF